MAPLLVLLQGALLFVAPAAVVTLVGLAHRGRGDCVGERRESIGVTSPCALALQNRPGANVHGREEEGTLLSRVLLLVFLSPTSAASTDRRPNLGEEGQRAAMGGERGPRAHSFGLLVGLKMAKLLFKGREDPGTL